jgi:hypothetical protein
MGPAQARTYQKQIPTAPNGYGPQRAQGVPTIPNQDTGPYFRAISPKMWAGTDGWRFQNPSAVGAGYVNQYANDPDGNRMIGAERELLRYPRLRRALPSELTAVQVGMGGDYQGLGQQPREAIATAASTIVARQGNQVVGGNTTAFMPPPDKF